MIPDGTQDDVPAMDEESNEENEEHIREYNNEKREQNLDFFDFAKKFATPKAMQACSLLLADFEKNSTYTNHCLTKLLHRVAWDLKSPGLLFQATLFRTFQRVLNSKSAAHKELAKLAIFVIRKFTMVAQTNKIVFMELLFWKSAAEVYDIEQGYGSYQEKSKLSAMLWSEEQEDELKRLFVEFERDKPGPDAVDWIMENLINQQRSRRSVVKKLRELYLLTGPLPKKSFGSRPPLSWGEGEIEELTHLYSELKTSFDLIGSILERLSVRRPKKAVVEKILELGLASDRKELRKKRSSKVNQVRPPSRNSSEEGSSEAESGEEGVGRPERFTANSLLVIAVVQRVVRSGRMGALVWLRDCLEESLGGLESRDCGAAGHALLPLSEENRSAMGNPLFTALLQTLHLRRPSDRDENWQIPSDWSAEDHRSRLNLIQDALDGKLTGKGDDDVPSTVQLNDRSWSDAGSSSRLEDGLGNTSVLQTPTAKKEKKVTLGSDCEDMGENSALSSDQNPFIQLSGRSSLAGEASKIISPRVHWSKTKRKQKTKTCRMKLNASVDGDLPKDRNTSVRENKDSWSTHPLKALNKRLADSKGSQHKTQKKRAKHSGSESGERPGEFAAESGADLTCGDITSRVLTEESTSDADIDSTPQYLGRKKRYHSISNSDSDGPENSTLSSQLTERVSRAEKKLSKEASPSTWRPVYNKVPTKRNRTNHSDKKTSKNGQLLDGGDVPHQHNGHPQLLPVRDYDNKSEIGSQRTMKKKHKRVQTVDSESDEGPNQVGGLSPTPISPLSRARGAEADHWQDGQMDELNIDLAHSSMHPVTNKRYHNILESDSDTAWNDQDGTGEAMNVHLRSQMSVESENEDLTLQIAKKKKRCIRLDSDSD